jgi:threonylcarbamoyladenosine tRNA methylthiotransferase MtaB
MRVAFYTLGCKVNQYETAVMTQQFAAGGFDIVQPEEDADVYIVNSCTVTAHGDKKSRQMLRRFRRQNPAAVICLCGCFPQAFPAVADELPEADIIMGARRRDALFAAVRRRLAGEGRIVDIRPHEKGEAFESMQTSRMAERTRAFVKIEDGCERFCAYCIIPKARGPVRSKPLAELETELRELAANGYREVVLVGINLSSYGLDCGLRLLDAVRLACGVSGIERVRLGSLEPELLTDDDITALAILPKLCPQFHLSLQSGCDATLARMRRHYDTAEYRRIALSLRRVFPGCALTTDIMVGFPGETEEEHRLSLAFAEEIGFAKAHVFAFSPRPGTLAAGLPDPVSNADKLRRSREMIAATERSRLAFLQAQIGTVAEVLFETREDGLWRGYSTNYTPVVMASDEDLSGKIVAVSITGVEGDVCVGGR